MMFESEDRQDPRDSLLLMADLLIHGQEGEHRVKVRNLSARGMMAEGAVGPVIFMLVEVKIRNIGWLAGTIAWVLGNRFGIAFHNEIEPKLARMPLTIGEGTPRYTKPAVADLTTGRPARRI